MFSEKFVWGVATSAYQIEGAAYEDGKGINIWDVFTKQEGKVVGGETGEIACDHYHRFKEDIALMKQLGVKAYRFSLNWTRILPEGMTKINQEGIDYYNKIIDELLANDITPYLTMYHWDFPYALHKKGGWLNPHTIEWFAEYAQVVAENFTDRVTHIITMNEPQVFAYNGYLKGEHAPGYQSCASDGFQMIHNTLRAHGKGVQMLRKYAKQPLQISFAPTGAFHYPATNSPEDIEAARMATMGLSDNPIDAAKSVTWWLDALFFGQYPKEGLEKYKEYLPVITSEDMELIAQPLDFLGQNIYSGSPVRMGADGKPEFVAHEVGKPVTAMKWPITPESLYWGPKFLYERYGQPIMITENGLSCPDVISLDGEVHDSNRIDFMHRYLRELRRVSRDGVAVLGYFAWSLLDNFEWQNGYAERFGLIYVNYATQERTIKDSGYWYKNVIESNGTTL